MSKPSRLSACLTLSDFLSTMYDQYWVLDMGNRLNPLNKTTLLAFEQCQQRYPFPWLKHAWLGLIMKHGQTTRIWFLKLPLDEQGMLIQASRDEFLQQLLMTLNYASQTEDQMETHLKHSPLAFSPNENLMAAFHARACTLLKQPPSSHFDALVDHLNSQDLSQGWQAIGLQGVADYVEHLSSDNVYSQRLVQCWSHIPQPVKVQVAIQCENIQLYYNLATLLLQYGQQLAQPSDADSITACLPFLRAISQTKADAQRQQWILDLLAHDTSNKVELLALIASKCQQDLADNAQVLSQFLLAASHQQQVFNALVSELMYQPKLRQGILDAVRKPDRNPYIAKAFGQMLT